MNNKKFSRRNFIQGGLLGLGLSSIGIDNLLEGISKNIINDLMASELNDNNLNYVGLHLLGGPNRWIWDLPLKINPSDTIKYNPSVITSFNADPSSVDDFGQYQCQTVSGISLPPIWGTNVKASSAGSDGSVSAGDIAMSELADNCLFIRGVVYPNGAHEGRWHNVIPFFGAPGIHTFPQGQNNFNRPMDCVQYSVSRINYPYLPRGQGSAINIRFNSGENPISPLLKPFEFGAHSYQSKALSALPSKGFADSTINSKINHALEKLEVIAKKNNKKSGKLFIDHKRAKEQFLNDVANVITEFNLAKDKYTEVISLNLLSKTIPGVDLQDHISNADFPQFYSYRDGKKIPSGVNLNDLFNEANIDSLAYSMALTEVLIKNKLTSSIVLGVGGINNLSYNVSSKVTFDLNNDSHFVGTGLSLVGFSKYYKAISGCLLTLKAYLQGIQEWDKTIIHIHGDFNRNPRIDGTGTDHGPGGSNTTILSGLVDGAKVIGGTYVNSPGHLNNDWGIAAPFTGGIFADEPFTNHHLEASFAKIFGAVSSVNVPALFEIRNGKIQPTSVVQNSGVNVPWVT